MARLEIDRITKRYGEVHAVRDVSLDVADGEFVVLLGPSGCGKTTTLRVIAGFAKPTSGAVRLGERDITYLPPWKRNAGLVFQSYALFPHLTVAENVAFGLEMRKVSKSEMNDRIREALRLVQLGQLGERLPRQLSGGQQQRVALARALVFRPDVLLLDEPLSNLDAKLRQEVRVEIRRAAAQAGSYHGDGHARSGGSAHHGRSARGDERCHASAPDRYATGSLRTSYRQNSSAGFVGRSTFTDGEVEGPGRFRSVGGLVLSCNATTAGPATLALRPERIILGSAQNGGMDNHLPGVVEFVSYLGATVDVHVRISPKERVLAQLPNRADGSISKVGDNVHVAWPAGDGIVLSGVLRELS